MGRFGGSLLVMWLAGILAACSTTPATEEQKLGVVPKATLSDPATTDRADSLGEKPPLRAKIDVPISGSAQPRSEAPTFATGPVSAMDPDTLDDDSPEARHRAELMARGEWPVPASSRKSEAKPVFSDHYDSCRHLEGTSKQSKSAKSLPLGITECEAIRQIGQPRKVQDFTTAGGQRRLLMTYPGKDNRNIYVEFVDNRLVAIY